MREVKFRAWYKEENKMLDSFDAIKEFTTEQDGYYPEECIFMQYTGLKDKNGKEIYEGDILERKNHHRRLVIWKDDAFVLEYLSSDTGNEGGFYRLKGFLKGKDEYQAEIIGNIYENPGLLKEDTNE